MEAHFKAIAPKYPRDEEKFASELKVSTSICRARRQDLWTFCARTGNQGARWVGECVHEQTAIDHNSPLQTGWGGEKVITRKSVK